MYSASIKTLQDQLDLVGKTWAASACYGRATEFKARKVKVASQRACVGEGYIFSIVLSGRSNNVTSLVPGYPPPRPGLPPPQRRSTGMLLILWAVDPEDVFGRHSGPLD